MKSIDYYFTFRGRISRMTYWTLYALPGYALLYVLDYVYMVSDPIIHLVVTVIVALLILAALVSGAVKRFHDLNKSAWRALILAVPIGLSVAREFGLQAYISAREWLTWVSRAIMLVCFWPLLQMACCKGMTGPNKYGEDPLEWGR